MNDNYGCFVIMCCVVYAIVKPREQKNKRKVRK